MSNNITLLSSSAATYINHHLLFTYWISFLFHFFGASHNNFGLHSLLLLVAKQDLLHFDQHYLSYHFISGFSLFLNSNDQLHKNDHKSLI
ncbi:hypothetical protein K450DRAFT_247175 [Umbelopsis ramanniana AG]|uniref:Uncharacterized protein n=1 Tax=Umbelopsis ramanniana AG TaxID=1314678 RepID=A0AAD5E6W8_UMBRA|nr:uncharacterized protein K450DRAFT_247175 [Umbelopsis ramanniana AG]KAI8578496.1 hypothetical protein K450DRAFT_247175 [Umbelopsis ramanniana AG]